MAPQTTLTQSGGTRGTAARGRARARAALVVGELALAVMLLAGAGLVIRSFWNLLATDAGFETGGVLKAEYQLPASRLSRRHARLAGVRRTACGHTRDPSVALRSN